MMARPLDQIRAETKAAHRAPHLRKRNLSGADQIDALANIGVIPGAAPYHHDGPYEATLAARNRDPRIAPVAAVASTNEMALRATPREHVDDSLRRHVPLQGVATIPPGERDAFGRVYDYEEGADLMREEDAPGGAYKRWEGVQYHPDDLKGKGEPSYTVERDLKQREGHSRKLSGADGTQGQWPIRVDLAADCKMSPVYEMQPRSRHSRHSSGVSTGKEGGHTRVRSRGMSASEAGPSSSSSPGKKIGEGLKRRFGSLHHKGSRRSSQDDDNDDDYL
ncbi:hypothetical protein GGR56DRAFT_666810 [Xylariaceae sp. FL0804]|nr:hypothetical protein GGR56DRAFT_666810 [Xylariaceae sp. FL0804]